MISKTAKQDVEQLTKDGYSPTYDEIIQLNDLGVRIERGKETTPANMPRIGFAGGVILHEPTIGSTIWWDEYGRDSAFTNDGRLYTYMFMLANSINIDYLNGLDTPKKIRKEVRNWKRRCGATDKELWRAMMYVKFGCEEVESEQRTIIDNTLEQEDRMNDLWQMVIMVSGATNIHPDDLKTQTQSSLIGMLVQANLHARIPMKGSVAKDYIAYQQLIRQIEERGKVNG